MSRKILQYLPPKISNIINNLKFKLGKEILEIRLRVNQPLQIVTDSKHHYITQNGALTPDSSQGYCITGEDIKKAKLILTENSIYALKRQLKQGFITIPGGHRVGFTGEVIFENNEIKTIKNINSLNYRITREVIGSAKKIVKKIFNFRERRFFNTLIISPPICGKTTLLRDLIRIISYGEKSTGIKGRTVGVVDERSEIAGSYNGIPQNDIGPRTDVLDNCPKAEGMMLLIRSMSPEIIAVDEIGKKDDIKAIREVLNAGVTLITTIHGNSLPSLKLRSDVGGLIKDNLFQRYIILNKKKGIGTVEKILNHSLQEVS